MEHKVKNHLCIVERTEQYKTLGFCPQFKLQQLLNFRLVFQTLFSHIKISNHSQVCFEDQMIQHLGPKFINLKISLGILLQ